MKHGIAALAQAPWGQNFLNFFKDEDIHILALASDLRFNCATSSGNPAGKG
jgi:hypothetical protein